MGRITTPKYRVEFLALSKGRWTPAVWRGPHPTDNALAHYVANMEKSTRPGGANAHIGATHVYRAQIIDQTTGNVVATYEG